MAWCKGPGARAPPRLPMPVSQRTIVWDFDPDFGGFWGRKKVRILTIPLCWGPPGALPRHFCRLRHFSKTLKKCLSGRILCFSGKKSWAKMAILSPGPNVDRSRSGAGPGTGGSKSLRPLPAEPTHARLLSRAAGVNFIRHQERMPD